MRLRRRRREQPLQCRLEDAPCPREACALWEQNGCAVEQFGLGRLEPELATFLLGIRRRLEEARKSDA